MTSNLIRRTAAAVVAATTALALVPAGVARAQLPHRTVALVGRQAPGGAAGVKYTGFGQFRVNDVGQIAFTAGLAGPGVVSGLTDGALLVGPVAAPALAARSGDVVPVTGERLGYIAVAALNNAGRVAVFDGSTLYTGAPTALRRVARYGDPAPGTPAGTMYGELFDVSYNDAGQVAFRERVEGPAITRYVDDSAIYAAGPGPGPSTLVARSRDAAPGGGQYSSLGNVSITPGGVIRFSQDGTAYAGEPGHVARVAHGGDPAPGAGPGFTYGFAVGQGYPGGRADGYVAFRTKLAGPAWYGDAIFAGPPGALAPVARDGDPVPGRPGATILLGPNGAFVTARGEVIFRTYVRDADGRETQAILAARAGSLGVALAFDVDTPLPGTGGGPNDAGQFLYAARIAHGDAVTRGLFAYDPAGGLAALAVGGAPFDVGGGELRTVADVYDATLGGDGTAAFELAFTDGTTGIFAATVPEPTALAWAAGAAGAALLGRRRRPAAAAGVSHGTSRPV